MMKPLYIGIVTACIVIIFGLVMKDLQLAMNITSWIGIILLVVAMLLSGVFVSGDRMRANQAAETTERRKERNKTTFNALLMAIPNFATAIALYVFLP